MKPLGQPTRPAHSSEAPVLLVRRLRCGRAVAPKSRSISGEAGAESWGYEFVRDDRGIVTRRP